MFQSRRPIIQKKSGERLITPAAWMFNFVRLELPNVGSYNDIVRTQSSAQYAPMRKITTPKVLKMIVRSRASDQFST